MEYPQMNIFQTPGEELRDKGIKKAIDHAEQTHDNWTTKAMTFMKYFALTHHTFMCEDVRRASKGHVPEPPSKRAWGAIIRNAVRAGMIKKIGTKSVKNPKAHCANAAVWVVK